jgi:propanol-preferring alcohol dehydrogenase
MSSIMTEFKGAAAIVTGPYGQPYIFEQLTTMLPSNAEAVVKLDFSGVCHGDVYMRDGGDQRLRHRTAH